MISSFMGNITDPQFLFVALTGLAVFATIFTLLMPFLSGGELQSRRCRPPPQGWQPEGGQPEGGHPCNC